MMLTEQTQISVAVLPVQQLKDHLRLGSGFSDSTLQDSLLQSYLLAAIGVIEKRIGKILISRRFLLTLEDWRKRDEQALPVSPVTALVSIVLRDSANVATVVAPASYRLVQDTHRPKLVARGILLPSTVEGGKIEVTFDAGFGATWALIPADLGHAVLLLAAEFYEDRHQTEPTRNGLPGMVQSLIERWRVVRVLGGREA
jgi:uncharacterized phiE125 gp8 family phage protein